MQATVKAGGTRALLPAISRARAAWAQQLSQSEAAPQGLAVRQLPRPQHAVREPAQAWM